MDAFHPHGRVRECGRPDHRARGRVLSRGRRREALPRRARRALLGEHRLLVRRRDRAGRARADAGAALLHELVVRAPAGDRARGGGGLARAGRPEPRLLLLGRLGGGRVGVEARAPVLPRAWNEVSALQGDRAADRVPRDDVRRAHAERHPADPRAVRAAAPRGAARLEHEPLPPPAGRDRGGVHALPSRRARGGDRGDGARDRVPRAHGAGAERGRRVHAAGGLLAGRARDLRPPRDPALGRRGHHRVRPARALVRLRALRHPARHRDDGEGAVLVLRRYRRRRRDEPRHGAVPHGHRDVLARDHLRRPPGDVRDRTQEHRDHEAGASPRARAARTRTRSARRSSSCSSCRSSATCAGRASSTRSSS